MSKVNLSNPRNKFDASKSCFKLEAFSLFKNYGNYIRRHECYERKQIRGAEID